MHPWIGLTIAQVLALCGAQPGDLLMVDEPPGKLRGVELLCHEGGNARRVLLEVEYHTGLFSPERAWDSQVVREQKVVGVRESAGPED